MSQIFFLSLQLKRQETGAGNSGRVLSDEQITEISQSADKLVKGLPVFEPKPLSQKKDINKQIYVNLNFSDCFDFYARGFND